MRLSCCVRAPFRFVTVSPPNGFKTAELLRHVRHAHRGQPLPAESRTSCLLSAHYDSRDRHTPGHAASPWSLAGRSTFAGGRLPRLQWLSYPDQTHRVITRDDRMSRQHLEEADGRYGCFSLLRELPPVPSQQRDKTPRGIDAIISSFAHASQLELNPTFPIASGTDCENVTIETRSSDTNG